MKKILITAIFILIYITGFSQSNDSIIKKTDEICKTILSEQGLQTLMLNDKEFLDSAFVNQPAHGFGTLTAYYRNGQLSRIYAYYGIKDMKNYAYVNYFFDNGKLICVTETEMNGAEISTDSSGTVDYKSSQQIFAGTYYFQNDKVIHRIVKGDSFLVPNEKFFDSQSKEGQLLESVREYKNLLTKKQKQLK